MKVKYLILGAVMMASCTQKSPVSLPLKGAIPSVSSDKSAPLGVQQAAALWTEADGTQAEFEQLVADHLCPTDSERVALF